MNILRDKHGRDGVKWALENWAKDPITCTAIVGGQMNGYRTTHPQGSTYLRETNDPDALAAMCVFELERCGVRDFVADPARSKDVGAGERVRLFFDDSKTHYSFAVPTFRERLTKLLDLSEGDADGARKVLRGAK